MIILAVILLLISPTGHTAIVMSSQDSCKDAAQKIETLAASQDYSCPAHGGGCWSAYGISKVAAMCVEGNLDEALSKGMEEFDPKNEVPNH